MLVSNKVCFGSTRGCAYSLLRFGVGAHHTGTGHRRTDVCERRRGMRCPARIARAGRRKRRHACGSSKAAPQQHPAAFYGSLIAARTCECEGSCDPAHHTTCLSTEPTTQHLKPSTKTCTPDTCAARLPSVCAEGVRRPMTGGS